MARSAVMVFMLLSTEAMCEVAVEKRRGFDLVRWTWVCVFDMCERGKESN